MEGLRSKLFYKFEAIILKMSRKRSKYRQWYIKQKDDAIGRELLAMDKFGNKYYQYYRFHGLPTKRMVLYKFFDSNKFNVDPHFVGWLYRRDILPPTPEELEKLYLEHDAFRERAIEWDENQRLMIEEYHRTRKVLDEKYEREKQIMLENGQ